MSLSCSLQFKHKDTTENSIYLTWLSEFLLGELWPAFEQTHLSTVLPNLSGTIRTAHIDLFSMIHQHYQLYNLKENLFCFPLGFITVEMVFTQKVDQLSKCSPSINPMHLSQRRSKVLIIERTHIVCILPLSAGKLMATHQNTKLAHTMEKPVCVRLICQVTSRKPRVYHVPQWSPGCYTYRTTYSAELTWAVLWLKDRRWGSACVFFRTCGHKACGMIKCCSSGIPGITQAGLWFKG